MSRVASVTGGTLLIFVNKPKELTFDTPCAVTLQPHFV